MSELEVLIVDISKLGLVAAVLAVVLAVVRSVLQGQVGDRKADPAAAPGAQRMSLPAPAAAGSPGAVPGVEARAVQAAGAAADEAAQAVAGEARNKKADEEGVMSIAEGESLAQFKARLKKSVAPKKSSISAEMLDTANSYDDKVALVRMLVSEDSGRVAAVLKNMIQRDLGG